MGRDYRERKQTAIEDIAKWAGQHVIKEEPVRSFRFHGHYIDKKHDKGIELIRPGFRVYHPSEGAKFAYTSTYCFTLTWTPGHMTIVGDLGELTVVHYQAMPTLIEACKWLRSDDYDYLLSKTNVKREFDRAGTVKEIWEMITEEATEHLKYYAQEIEEHAADKPKWRKRDGMSKADFDMEMESWEGDHPRHSYGFRKCRQPIYANRNLWSEDEKMGWTAPDGFTLVARAWHSLNEEGYSVPDDPNELLTEEGMEDLREAVESYCQEKGDEDIQSWCYHELDRDWSGSYEYPHRAFIQIAAIQHGARLIEDQILNRKAAA